MVFMGLQDRFDGVDLMVFLGLVIPIEWGGFGGFFGAGISIGWSGFDGSHSQLNRVNFMAGGGLGWRGVVSVIR